MRPAAAVATAAAAAPAAAAPTRVGCAVPEVGGHVEHLQARQRAAKHSSNTPQYPAAEEHSTVACTSLWREEGSPFSSSFPTRSASPPHAISQASARDSPSCSAAPATAPAHLRHAVARPRAVEGALQLRRAAVRGVLQRGEHRGCALVVRGPLGVRRHAVLLPAILELPCRGGRRWAQFLACASDSGSMRKVSF